MGVEQQNGMTAATASPGGCCGPDDISIDNVHGRLLKIGGSLCIVFGVVELGLGAYAYNFLDYPQLGAWWCSILTVAAGIFAVAASKKGFVVTACVFASLSVVITLVGSIVDGISAQIFQSLTACSYTDPETSYISFYGHKGDYSAASECSEKESIFDPINACSCVDSGAFCMKYALSDIAKGSSQNCGNILSTYSNVLSASTAFCVFCLLAVFFVSILTCTLLCCPSRSPLLGRKLDEDGTEVGVKGAPNA